MAQEDEIARTVGGYPEGVGIEALQQLFPVVPRRTLQRRLAGLVAGGRLLAEGEGRARVYRAPAEEVAERAGEAGTDEPVIPLSPAGLEIRRLVRRPLARRQPVGYERAFLLDYEPNRTAWLPSPLRTHLHAMGRAPVGDAHAGTYARQVLNRLLVDLSWASSHLEGNTYSRLDTQNLIEFGRLAEGKDRLEAQMILNHKAAIEMLVDQADAIAFNRYTVQNLHALLAENLLPEPASGGRVRRIDVGISGSVFQPLSIPQQVDELFGVLLEKAQAINDPFEQAFFVMVQLPYLQPFEDVNKRVSRLAANIPLIKGNLAPLSFVDVPRGEYTEGTLGVYELKRIELLRDVFAWAYERSCQRYTVLRDALPQPDLLRLRHRELLRTVIANLVRSGAQGGDTAAIRAMVEPLVAAEEMDDVVALVINEIHQLHEGNIARYQLRLSEFRRWLELQQDGAR